MNATAQYTLPASTVKHHMKPQHRTCCC